MEFQDDSKAEEKLKILFTGLDNAGKTTIISISKSKIKFINFEASEWDLGGQVTYRNAYINNPDKNILGIEIVIYVIDIQDHTRFFETISYFKEIIERFKIIEVAPPIYIFFHKYDPNLTGHALDELKAKKRDLREEMKNSIQFKQIYYYTTSMYDPNTITNAMLEILSNFNPNLK